MIIQCSMLAKPGVDRAETSEAMRAVLVDNCMRKRAVPVRMIEYVVLPAGTIGVRRPKLRPDGRMDVVLRHGFKDTFSASVECELQSKTLDRGQIAAWIDANVKAAKTWTKPA